MSTHAFERDAPPPPGGRLYYGWILVLALGVTETVSYGILSYAFPVFIAPMKAELGWSATAITGAFSLALLVAGAAAVPAGRWVDRHGARGLMAGGSVLAAAVLLAWSGVERLWELYALSALLGAAMAAVLYEPAFALVASWFVRMRGRALTVLTFLGGFASVVFVPLATELVRVHGWRQALVWLAAILAVLTIPPHALLLRRRPEDHGLHPDGAREPAPRAATVRTSTTDLRALVRDASFPWLGASFALAALASTSVFVHLLPLLLERGYSAAFGASALGAMGLMALPGRLIFTPLGDRCPRSAVTAALFAAQAVGLLALLAGRGPWAVWAFVVLFGAGSGAITPARAALVADLYGRERYGAAGGALALVVSIARASAPVGASLVAVAGGYVALLAILVILSLVAASAVLASARPTSISPTPALP
jgi:MFS family permease